MRTRSSKRNTKAEVTYKLLQAGSYLPAVEVASVEEFLATATANEWIIFLDVQEQPAGPTYWCPCLQPILLQEGELAKQIRSTNCLNDIVVASKADPGFQWSIPVLKKEESCFLNFQEMLQEEDATTMKVKSRKQKRKSKKIPVGGSADTQMGEPAIHQDDEGTSTTMGEPAIHLDDEGTSTTMRDDIEVKEKQAEQEQGMKEKIEVKEESHKEQQDTLFFKEGEIMYEGKSWSSLELLVKLFEGQKELKTKLLEGQEKLKVELLEEQKKLKVELLEEQKKLKAELKKDAKELHLNLSAVAERMSRTSLSLLFGQNSGAEVEYPVTSRWMPYDPNHMKAKALEDLAMLYKKHEDDVTERALSGFIEIDLFIRNFNQELGVRVYTSPMTGRTSRLLSNKVSSFTGIFIGEYSRSTKLCASASQYEHPDSPCRSPSAKLLKKLVQVERGIIATLHYYDAETDSALVQAAAVVSPSFRQLTDPDSLIHKVLSNTDALPNLERLARQQKMWLIDA